MALVGLKNLVYAVMTDEKTETYGAVKSIAGAIDADIKPSINSSDLYADDGLSETRSALGKIEVSLTVKDVPKTALTDLLGHTVDANGVLIKKSSDNAPYVAIGFKSLKSNGEYRYKWLFKGKFTLPEEKHKTQEEKLEYQTQQITATFMRREKDEQWEASVDSDDTGIGETVISGWFTKVYGETA